MTTEVLLAASVFHLMACKWTCDRVSPGWIKTAILLLGGLLLTLPIAFLTAALFGLLADMSNSFDTRQFGSAFATAWGWLIVQHTLSVWIWRRAKTS